MYWRPDTVTEPEFEEPDFDLDEALNDIEEYHADLLDNNQRMIASARRRAHKMLDTSDRFEDMADRCRQIAEQNILIARHLADNTADLLASEFDIQEITIMDDGDED